MKRILIDVDSVVADLMPEWLAFYNAEYKDHLTKEDITDWNIEKFVKPECGKAIEKYLEYESLYNDVLPIDGAISSVHWLRHHGWDVRFVTSGVMESKVRWLGTHGFLTGENYLFSPDVIVASDKSIIKGDVLVDDRLQNCMSFPGRAILFAQPWNDVQTNYYRAYNWPDVIQYLVGA